MRERSPYVLVDYDPAWPWWFERVRAAVRSALGDLPCAVEHVGSTAVPGLAAKAVIDVDVVVTSPGLVPAAVERLGRSGWRHKGDRGIPGRQLFEPRADLPHHHLYLVVAGSTPHLDHVLLRDLLRRRPALADRYAAVKRRHAHLLPDDREGYLDAKSALIERLLATARVEAGLPADDGEQVHGVRYAWRERLDAAVLGGLLCAAGRTVEPGWWDGARPGALGWLSAWADGRLAGFALLTWDRAAEATLAELAVTGARDDVAAGLLGRAARRACAADCRWLRLDAEHPTVAGALRACGLRAGGGRLDLADGRAAG